MTVGSDILKEPLPWVTGGIVSFMLILTVIMCMKARLPKKKRKRPIRNGASFHINREDVCIYLRPRDKNERKSNNNSEEVAQDHENYALVDHSENCYVDLEAGEYDLLRSQRKHKPCFTETNQSSSYCQLDNHASGFYDVSGSCTQKDVLHPDYEYEMVKNMTKINTQSQDLTETEPTFSVDLPDSHDGTKDASYEDAISTVPTCTNVINAKTNRFSYLDISI
ncbi:uncharacterized protein LOC125648434 isoform X2 [Ostrea edulis]|uniref:uncharacterized protein LOC125648434 isoform X2 n=1 Tax=Ostrea edulis TaxID=37623 RepID=UPI002094A5B3|nr:uncharacterized protein LOC125648434 isoform X2 [Ostrea edulis]